MARFEFKQDPPPESWADRNTSLLNLVVRSLGLVLLLVGIFVALLVIGSAWSLYDDPASIETFANAIERGSNLDRALTQVTDRGEEQANGGSNSQVAPGSEVEQAADPQHPRFYFSYFAAWLIAMLLLLLTGHLAIVAIRTGGELALYDLQLKKMARMLIDARSEPNDKRA